ncbi:MAG: enoyl-CoA hydratase-related protein [Acidobacteriota bacterium]|jgi:enoyl-CoA hydratase/carnithine racemase|nr:enoyl-CoA hydratase-related protein [Acidobacteriota bacterium]MEE3151891.1 enoyl-CoA hydratase-related protein [Acidobacteriota bacterium]|tara:strand:+ start:587 stop:1372 length:786 start_codon:yes stop_codon:yes gene_type:complete
MAIFDHILVSNDDNISTVTLNRPDKLNALNRSAWQELADVFTELNGLGLVRCIIVRGAGGKAFSAGADISEFADERCNVAQATTYGSIVEGAINTIIEGPHPTIALVEGACVGGGLEIACACDIRICGESSRFGIPVSRLGLTMAYPELQALLSVVASPVAKEILFSGELFGAHRAAAVGLVNRVVADDLVQQETYALAARVVKGAPLVNRWHKKFIRRLADSKPLADEEVHESYKAFGTKDFRRGYRAFLGKTDPDFEGN